MKYLYILLFFYIGQILHSLFARMVSNFKKLYILLQKEKGL